MSERRRSASPVESRQPRQRTPPTLTSPAVDHHTNHHHRPDASKLDSQITVKELSKWLTYAQELTTAYVHPRPISFPTSANKANWSYGVEDPEGRDCYNSLSKHAPKSKNRLMLFATWTKSWVGRPWKEDSWHCWGAAMLDNSTGYGKHLVIFDSEADMSQDFTVVRPKEVMLCTQTSFIKWARGKHRLDSLWFGNAGITPTPFDCVRHTVEWIESFAPVLERKFQIGDSRLAGFARIDHR